MDTSVLVDLFRGRDTPAVRRLEDLESERVPYQLPMVCCQELLQGAKNRHEWKLLSDYLQTQRLVPPAEGWSHYERAARIYYDGRRKGVTIRSTVDCTIAQLVLDHDGTLLHDDDDFERIREIRPLRTDRG